MGLKVILKAFKERGISCFETDKNKLFCLCRASAGVTTSTAKAQLKVTGN
jgi:hypothetical protein